MLWLLERRSFDAGEPRTVAGDDVGSCRVCCRQVEAAKVRCRARMCGCQPVFSAAQPLLPYCATSRLGSRLGVILQQQVVNLRCAAFRIPYLDKSSTHCEPVSLNRLHPGHKHTCYNVSAATMDFVFLKQVHPKHRPQHDRALPPFSKTRQHPAQHACELCISHTAHPAAALCLFLAATQRRAVRSRAAVVVGRGGTAGRRRCW